MTPETIPLRWLAAISARDENTLLALSAPDITLFGPRGAAKGHDVLKRWFDNTRVEAIPQKILVAGDRLMVLHRSIWRDEAGEVIGTADSGSVFTIIDGKVATYLRDDNPHHLSNQGFRGAREIPLPELSR